MGRVVYLRREQPSAPGRQDPSGVEVPRRQPIRAAEPPRSASLLKPGSNCTAIARAERLAILVDGDAYFRAFYEAALRAERSITILGWDFNSGTQLHFDPVPRHGPPALLGDFLNWLAKRRRRLRVNILDWDYPMVFGTDREFPPIYGFGWKPHRRVQMHYDDTHPVAGCQHQKIVIIDEQVAFVGGIDLTVRRWDTSEHLPGDPRRTCGGKPYPPFHDMMVMVDGEAARALNRIAAERWQAATGQHLHAGASSLDVWPKSVPPLLTGTEIGIARTHPPRGERPAVREIERLYLDMIRAARHCIYIENQYFTAPGIAAALAERLAEDDGPEIVLVLRLLSHGWLEEHTMHVLRTSLLETLQKADRHGRFRVYYPHIAGLEEGTCVDVHAKLMIVDDDWLRVGSSNLCNRSLGLDTECDVLIESRGDETIARVIRDFRLSRIAEHVGDTTQNLERALAEHGSIHAAIEKLGSDTRRLANLDAVKWPDAIVTLASVADPDEPISLDSLLSERSYDGPEATRRAKPAWGRLAMIAGGIAALAAFWQFGPLKETINAQSAIAWAQDAASNPWAALLLIAAYTPVAFTMFPRPLVSLASVIAYGPWIGFAIAMAGVVSSAVVTYYVGRRMRRDTVRRLAGERVHEMVEVLRKHGLLAMTLLRLVPLAPFAIEGLVAGAVRLPLWQLALGTFLGNLPGVFAATVFGNELEAALSGRGEFNWWLIGGMALLLAVGAVFVRGWFRRMKRDIDSDKAASDLSSPGSTA